MVIEKILAACLRAFVKAERGNVAMMFALSLIPIMIGAGVGLDFARAMLVRQQMGEALDAAALAVGSTPGLSQSDAQNLAQRYFDSNYTVDKTDYGTPAITVPSSSYNSTGSVTITASDAMPTVLVKLIGINSIPINTTSNVVWGQTNLWVALVLDTSSSMTERDSAGTKMAAVQSAANSLLDILKQASAKGGDAEVSIVPFGKDVIVGTANAGASWIDWRNWECPPQKTSDGNDCTDPIQPTDAVLNGQSLQTFGSGDSCPFNGNRGYICAQTSVNDPYCSAAGGPTCPTVLPIPSSGTYNGYICPSMNAGYGQPGLAGHFYNGCWVPNGSSTIVSTGNSASCTGYTSTTCGCVISPGSFFGVAAGTKVCVILPAVLGIGSSATCTGHSTASNCGCASGVLFSFGTFSFGSSGNNVCLAKVWNLTWTSNNHSTWTGCVMDRDKDYDIANTTLGVANSLFPAENNTLCGLTTMMKLSSSWDSLKSQINAMTTNSIISTNQAIGIAHGWQSLTPGDPYGAPAVPANTTRYMIVLSDGLNSQDRWWDTAVANIDAREKATCDAAKANGIVIYTIFVNFSGSSGNSAPLQYCASDATKYFTLTSTGAVVTTFQQIAQQITNLRVVK